MAKKIVFVFLGCLVIVQAVFIWYLLRERSGNQGEQSKEKAVPAEISEQKETKIAGKEVPKEVVWKTPTAYDCIQIIEKWEKESQSKAKEIEKYRQEAEKNPSDARVQFALAQIYLSIPEEQDKAADHFRRTLEIMPGHPQAKIIEFWLKSHEENRKRAAIQQEMDAQQERLRKDGNNPEEYLRMARIYRKHNFILPAESYYRKAAELGQENAERLLEAGLFLKENHYREALGYLKRGLKLEGNHPKKEEIEGYIRGLEEKVNRQRYLYEKDASEDNVLASLKVQLEDESDAQKKEAIERLSGMKSEAAVTMLQECVKDEKKKGVWREAVAALRKIGTTQARKALEEILYESVESLKIDAILAYVKYGDEEDVSLLKKWSQEESGKKYRPQAEWAVKEVKRRMERKN